MVPNQEAAVKVLGDELTDLLTSMHYCIWIRLVRLFRRNQSADLSLHVHRKSADDITCYVGRTLLLCKGRAQGARLRILVASLLEPKPDVLLQVQQPMRLQASP